MRPLRTEVTGCNADRIAMNYWMHKTPEGWNVYCVNVDGIGYIKGCRDDFGAEIQQLRLDSLIAHLEEGETQVRPRRDDLNR